jgi:hypothetical protein
MLNLDIVQADIESWIENFVEVPHPSLGGWPPCPFARSSRLKRTYVRVSVITLEVSGGGKQKKSLTNFVKFFVL